MHIAERCVNHEKCPANVLRRRVAELSIFIWGGVKQERWIDKNWDKIYFGILAMFYVWVMQKNSIDGSFWGDEVWNLGWIYTKDPNKMYIVYNFITRIWFRVMPYGQQNLLLLSQMFSAGAICLAGLAGTVFRGKRFGVLFSSVTAFSVTIAYQCSMEFRPYAMLLFCTTLVLYLFVRRQHDLGYEKLGNLILYSIALALTMDTHTFGIAIVGLLLVADFGLIITGKVSRRRLIEFIFPAGYGVYWLFTQFIFNLKDINNYSWMGGTANGHKMYNTVKWLCGNNEIFVFVVIVGIVTIFGGVCRKMITAEFDVSRDCTELILGLIPFILIGVVYFYSSVLNPQNSLFIDRYFISCIIFILFLLSMGFDALIELVCRSGVNEKGCVVIFVISLCAFSWTKIMPWDINEAMDRTSVEPARQAAEYIMELDDIHQENVLCIVDHNDYVNEGMEYYFSHKGQRESIRHVGMWDLEKIDKDYDVIYVTDVFRGYRYNPELNVFLDENYTQTELKTAYAKKFIRKQGTT